MLYEWVSVFKGLKYFVIIWWWVLTSMVTFRILYTIPQETGGDCFSGSCNVFVLYPRMERSSMIISRCVALLVDFWALTWLGCVSSQNLQYWNTRFFQYFSRYISKKWPTRGMLMFDFLNVIVIFQHNTLISLHSL